MARQWRSRIALLLAHWIPSSPNSTAFAPAITPQNPPTQTSPSPPQRSPSGKSSAIAPPPPKPKPDSHTTPSSVKVAPIDAPKPLRTSPSGSGDRGKGGGGGEREGGKGESGRSLTRGGHTPGGSGLMLRTYLSAQREGEPHLRPQLMPRNQHTESIRRTVKHSCPPSSGNRRCPIVLHISVFLTHPTKVLVPTVALDTVYRS